MRGMQMIGRRIECYVKGVDVRSRPVQLFAVLDNVGRLKGWCVGAGLSDEDVTAIFAEAKRLFLYEDLDEWDALVNAVMERAPCYGIDSHPEEARVEWFNFPPSRRAV